MIFFNHIKTRSYRGTWVAQSFKHPTSAQVMVSWFMSSSSASGSRLTAQTLVPASDSISLSLSLSLSLCVPPLLRLRLSLSKINVKKILKTWSYIEYAIYSSIIHNMQKVEATQVSIDGWMNKMWYIHTRESYSTLKEKKIVTHFTTWVNLEDIMLKWYKPITKQQMLYSPYMRFLEQSNSQRQKIAWWLPGTGGGKMRSHFLMNTKF